MEEKLVTILNEMAEYLSIAQMKKLQEVLLKNLAENEPQKAEISNAEYLQMFLDAKKIEGCSERTLQYYRVTVERMLQSTTTPIRKICTEEIRSYLSGYQQINGCGKVTVDNIRRNISSFFSWLEEEDYMIYIGDSDTDIPCMKLVNSYGGHSIGVYNADTQDKKKVYKMMHDKRIKYFAAADYSEGRELDTLLVRQKKY